MAREDDLDRLYDLLNRLETRIGGARKLKDCTGYMDWPERGVYFFLSAGERRSEHDQRRVTRVGTHAVSSGSGASMWDRLRTHRGATSGTYEGGGNHRGSVFRRHVGEAMIEQDGLHQEYSHWGEGSSADRDRRLEELELERRVSDYVRTLPFLWISVDDEPGPESDRAYIERNAIALLSNFQKETIDRRSETWVGRHSPTTEVCESGLWNVNHVDETYDPGFLDRLQTYIEGTEPL